LSNKWRIFQRPLNPLNAELNPIYLLALLGAHHILHVSGLRVNVNPDFAVDIVKAYVVLHIFVRERDGYKFEDAMTMTCLEDVPDGQSVCGGLTANNVRNTVADYFLTDAGAVPWQMLKYEQ